MYESVISYYIISCHIISCRDVPVGLTVGFWVGLEVGVRDPPLTLVTCTARGPSPLMNATAELLLLLPNNRLFPPSLALVLVVSLPLPLPLVVILPLLLPLPLTLLLLVAPLLLLAARPVSALRMAEENPALAGEVKPPKEAALIPAGQGKRSARGGGSGGKGCEG